MPEQEMDAEIVTPDAPPEVDEAVLAEARQMGWQPLEKFRGDPSKWTDAKTYVDRGKEIMPLLRANNAKLLGELSTVREQLQAATSAIEQLREASAEITKERVKAVRKELQAGIRTAREEGNIEQEEALTDKLAELRAAERETPSQAASKTGDTPAIDPAFLQWQAGEGSWFGQDQRRTALAMGIARELKEDPAHRNLTGLAFYEKVGAEVEAIFNPKPLRADRVEGSRGSGSIGNGKSYDALPADAKKVCDRQASQFVGKGFKDLAAWRAHYTSIYFGDQ